MASNRDLTNVTDVMETASKFNYSLIKVEDEEMKQELTSFFSQSQLPKVETTRKSYDMKLSENFIEKSIEDLTEMRKNNYEESCYNKMMTFDVKYKEMIATALEEADKKRELNEKLMTELLNKDLVLLQMKEDFERERREKLKYKKMAMSNASERDAYKKELKKEKKSASMNFRILESTLATQKANNNYLSTTTLPCVEPKSQVLAAPNMRNGSDSGLYMDSEPKRFSYVCLNHKQKRTSNMLSFENVNTKAQSPNDSSNSNMCHHQKRIRLAPGVNLEYEPEIQTIITSTATCNATKTVSLWKKLRKGFSAKNSKIMKKAKRSIKK